MGVAVLSHYRSDHHPLLVDSSFNYIKHKSYFRFFAMWTLNDSYKKLIENCWSIMIVGCPMWILAKKLSLLKLSPERWNWEVFGNWHRKIQISKHKLDVIQEQISLFSYSFSLWAQEQTTQLDLDFVLKQEEIFWVEKANL